MMKKNELIETLAQGGYIYMDDRGRRAIVYSMTDERLDSCRYDTAENLARQGGYDVVALGAWSFARRVEKTEVRQAARQAAAEELASIRTPGHIELRAKSDCWIGSARVTKGRHYSIWVFGNGVHQEPRCCSQNLYDFDYAEHAIYFEILSRPEAAQEATEEEENTMTNKTWTPAPDHIAVRNPKTEEILEGTPRAIYYALHQRTRWDRREGEPVATWEPVTRGAAAIITAAQAAAVREEADQIRCEICGEILGSEIYTDDLGRCCCYECFLERCEEQGFCDLSQEELDTQTTEARKAAALAAYLVEYENFTEDEAAEIERNYDGSYSCGSWEYQVMTEEEADEAARADILDSLWAFCPEFILSHMHDHGPTSIREDEAICKALRIMQEELCESATPIIRALIADLDEFVSDAIWADGRGHFISRYDGDEIELGEFYAYRQN